MTNVPRETSARLEELADAIRAEAAIQNLVAASTLDDLWSRHIVDSLQLLPLAPPHGRWLDVGSGAGFPGMVVALAGDHSLMLAEPRALRAAFLQRLVDRFDLASRVEIFAGKIERLPPQSFDIISARAVAATDRLFEMTHRFAHPGTVWVLPKGRSVREELEAARRSWQGDFRLVPSQTDPDAAILVATNVRRRAKR